MNNEQADIIKTENVNNRFEKIKACIFNKKAFTMVEMIIVIAVISVLTGLSVTGLVVVNGRKVYKTAKQIDAFIGEFSANATVREGDWKMQFEFNEAEARWYVRQYVNKEEHDSHDYDASWVLYDTLTMIKEIDLEFDDGQTDYNSDEFVRIGFNRATGEFRTDPGFFSGRIILSGFDRHSEIEMTARTGKHTVIND